MKPTLAWLSQCAALAVTVASPAFAYTNPVRAVDGPDPGVLYDKGTFWMVHTAGPVPGWPLRSASSLYGTWSAPAYMVTAANQPSWLTGPYWAPEIHRVQSQKATIPLYQTETFSYVIPFTGQRAGVGNWLVGTATAAAPNGSYSFSSGPLVEPDLAATILGGEVTL